MPQDFPEPLVAETSAWRRRWNIKVQPTPQRTLNFDFNVPVTVAPEAWASVPLHQHLEPHDKGHQRAAAARCTHALSSPRPRGRVSGLPRIYWTGLLRCLR
jgi:hypothetical protein